MITKEALSPQDYPGKRVEIKKVQKCLGRPKYPGRIGVIDRVHPFLESELLLYVKLDATARAKAREETFWLSDLIFLDCPVASIQTEKN